METKMAMETIHNDINKSAYRASEQSRPRRGCEAKPWQTIEAAAMAYQFNLAWDSSLCSEQAPARSEAYFKHTPQRRARSNAGMRSYDALYKMDKTSHGFTLIELVVVIAIMGLIMAVSLPVSYNMYLSYKASLKAEEVLVYISKARRESFLYDEEKVIYSKDGILYNNDAPVVFHDIFVQIDTAIKFYKNGTTSGGILKLYIGDYGYLLQVQSPFGNLLLEKAA